MNQLEFIKMHGTGNDFILIDGRNLYLNYKNLALELCPRHFGVGADGIIILENATTINNDYKMKIFNADGSEAEMCGNGIRTLIHFIRYSEINNKNSYRIETKAGIINCEVLSYHHDYSKIKVNMGKPEFDTEEIPANIDNSKEINDYKVSIDGKKFLLNSVSFGNPHTIIYVNDVDEILLNNWGKAIENYKIFPKKTNVEFVEFINEEKLKMRVWERGVGETLACGTGACAAAVISAKKGYTSDNINIELRGGNLKLKLKNNDIFMIGNSKVVYEGKINI